MKLYSLFCASIDADIRLSELEDARCRCTRGAKFELVNGFGGCAAEVGQVLKLDQQVAVRFTSHFLRVNSDCVLRVKHEPSDVQAKV